MEVFEGNTALESSWSDILQKKLTRPGREMSLKFSDVKLNIKDENSSGLEVKELLAPEGAFNLSNSAWEHSNKLKLNFTS